MFESPVASPSIRNTSFPHMVLREQCRLSALSQQSRSLPPLRRPPRTGCFAVGCLDTQTMPTSYNESSCTRNTDAPLATSREREREREREIRSRPLSLPTPARRCLGSRRSRLGWPREIQLVIYMARTHFGVPNRFFFVFCFFDYSVPLPCLAL